MPWWDFWKQKDRSSPDVLVEPTEVPPAAPPQAQMPAAEPVGQRQMIIGLRPVNLNDPTPSEQRARRRQRLERRVSDLGYDIRRAEETLHEPNRWSERIDGLTEAIEQTRRDIQAVLTAPPDWIGVPLPATLVVVEHVQPNEPAEVRVRIGDVSFRYAEDLDWAERGHQKTEAVLRRVDGDIDALLPPEIPSTQVDSLREHLAHGLSMLAEALRDAALDGAGTPQPTLTLADLATPCPDCGGWRDLKGRCPACQEREWHASALRADTDRLIKERNDAIEEMQRLRERLPVLRRQLADSEEELAKLAES